jgi:enamine deaminase RidA (YjgF/YER057c/UK114 family)
MDTNRKNISSNTPWEDKVGYSRAVRIDSNIYVSGTTATDIKGDIIGINDPYAQTIQCIENIKEALHKAGSELADVTRIRIYTTSIKDWEKIGAAINEYFKNIKPAATMVEVSKLISPEVLIEIEADAYVQ